MSAVSLSAVKPVEAARESLRIIAGPVDPAPVGALAVAEDSTGAPVLVKARAARAATDTRPERPASWVRTSRLADFAGAISAGLIDADL